MTLISRFKWMILWGTLFFIHQNVQGQARFGVNFHQSNIPMLGFSVEKNAVLGEVRIGADQQLESFSPELMIAYKFYRKSIAEAYVGIGARFNELDGLVLPIGVNIYPFSGDQFGFHIEATPILGFPGNDFSMIRGSWGIRYRF